LKDADGDTGLAVEKACKGTGFFGLRGTVWVLQKHDIYIYISTGKKHIFIILPNISMLDELTKDASVNIQNLPFFGGSGEFGR